MYFVQSRVGRIFGQSLLARPSILSVLELNPKAGKANIPKTTVPDRIQNCITPERLKNREDTPVKTTGVRLTILGSSSGLLIDDGACFLPFFPSHRVSLISLVKWVDRENTLPKKRRILPVLKEAGDTTQSKNFYLGYNKESICASRRSKYSQAKAKKDHSKANSTKTVVASALPHSEEETKAKNREKSRRYYAKNKSEIQSRRRAGRATVRHSNSLVGRLRPEISYAAWENRNTQLVAQFQDKCGGLTPLPFLQSLVEEYLRDGNWDIIEAARSSLDSHLTTVEEFVRSVLHAMGVGAPLKETMALSAQISQVLRYFNDMEIVRLECDSPSELPQEMGMSSTNSKNSKKMTSRVSCGTSLKSKHV
ncbi:hypothetical protein DFP72DRAFT_860397 [Ephemerocybe angulata]|uniref:Uncharacterized protein n=1 Tax=Ephemerocybe angulata TaxID=980116 RepID=A0A8H6H8K5_9AGAR|nr:hypothetical protein DFP72DRAFT_860397 [Tulosesus angulatus]